MESGTRLGPYEILELLGKGGMGEVWLAEDSRLGRKVAIKTLPPDFAMEPERVARFEQEARAAAALNHPNIAVVFDVGEHDAGARFIVQEYLEGQSLRDLLRDNPPKLGRALTIGAEVAQALAVAHSAGIVHRDIKPDNIFILDSGLAKVLDFGLAKLVDPGTFAGNSADSAPTAIGTMAGAVMGTAGYMAPEQVEAGEIDGRTDIFALGCVLYEMATGQRPFAADNLHSTLGRIVSHNHEPIRVLRPELPERLGWIVDKCLAKAPGRRYQHADDVAVDLRALQADLEESGASLPTQATSDTPPPPARLHPLGLSVGALLGAVAAAVALWSASSPPPLEVTRLTLELEEGSRLTTPLFEQRARPALPSFALSPDGRRVVYVATDGEGPQRLYLRELDRRLATAIPGTEGAYAPNFSPDGQWVGFGTLRIPEASGANPMTSVHRVPVGGGSVELISEMDGLAGPGSWNDDGRIYFPFVPASSEQAGIFRVPGSGGIPVRVSTSAGNYNHMFPQRLPGSAGVLFGLPHADDLGVPSRGNIVVLDPETGTQTLVIEGGSDARYLPSGHIVFMREGNLMAVAFDVETLAATSAPVVVVDNVMHAERATESERNTGTGQYSVSASGTLAYATGGVFRESTNVLEFIDADGSRERLAIEGSFLYGERVSPDGLRVAYTRGAPQQIWIYSVASQTPRPLTFDGENRNPVWSPDGTRIAFSSTREDAAPGLFWMAADGSGEPNRITTTESPRHFSADWSSDGILVYLDGRDIMFIDVEAGGEPEAFRQTPFSDQYPVLSPNGKWLAYTSDESGAEEVWVRAFRGGEPAYRITTDGGIAPVWARDGRRLFYKAGEESSRGIWGLEVTSETAFSIVGQPRLVHLDSMGCYPVRCYDVGPAGRFVAPTAGEPLANQPVTKLEVVLNWVEELKQRVPTGR